MNPAKTGIARLSSTWGNTVSTNVAMAAIGIMITQLPMIRYPMTKSTTNSAIMPSHAVSGIFFIQCFPNAIPKIAAAVSPKTAIRITVIAIGNSKRDSARMNPRMRYTWPPRVFSSFTRQKIWKIGIFLCSITLKNSIAMKNNRVANRTSIAILWPKSFMAM